MATLPMSSVTPATTATIPPTIPLTRAQIAQARRPRGAAITQRLARQRPARGWERLALWLAQLPHRLPLVMRFDAFWDTWAVRHPTNWTLRPRLRLGLAIERRHVLAALRAVQHASARTSWPRTDAAADVRWRAEVRDLLERLNVVVEYTTDHWGATHFSARDLTPARRAALTQPSLDALLLDADEPAESLALTRPHDATTQPALPIVRLSACTEPSLSHR